MKPQEHEYTSHVAYSRALEAYCDKQAAQVASLTKDIQDANDLLSKGDSNGALVQVRVAASRASKSYLECIGRAAAWGVTTHHAVQSQDSYLKQWLGEPVMEVTSGVITFLQTTVLPKGTKLYALPKEE